ncbi:hypothetical protein JCM3770_000134 [Rhodotorula araucariae]
MHAQSLPALVRIALVLPLLAPLAPLLGPSHSLVVDARDLSKCPAQYAACSGIWDWEPVCCPEGCSCVRDRGGFAFCMQPRAEPNDGGGYGGETPCCVQQSYCEVIHPDWPVCGSNDSSSGGIPSPAIATVPLATRTSRTRRPSSTSRNSRPSLSSDDADYFDITFDDDRDLFGSSSGLDELRLSGDWDINATPQKREYWFTIDERMGSPDGCASSTFSGAPRRLVVNGQYPGPLIEANNGDTIVVHVTNALEQPITLHWHGLVQNHSIWADGPSGVTQCPIGVGQSYTYSFPVASELEFGTYWWHAHRRALYVDGIIGPLIIHSPRDPLVRGRDYDIDQIVMLVDWYHDTADFLVDALLSPEGLNGSFLAPSPQSQLINSHGIYNCSMSIRDGRCDQKRQHDLPGLLFPPDKKIRLRFIHAGAHPVIFASVDEHELRVIEADDTGVFGPAVHRIALNVAQRYSAVLDTSFNDVGDSFYLRAEINTGCLGAPFDDLDPQARMSIRIGEKGDDFDDRLPSTRDWSDSSTGNCTDLDESLLHPRIVRHVPDSADQISFFNSSRIGSLTATGGTSDILEWTLNNITFENFAYDPILHQVVRGERIANGRFAYIVADELETVDIVVQNIEGPDHPFHLHGKPMSILARGTGQLSPSEASTLRLKTFNPLRRDTIGVPRGEWVLVRIVSDVVGVFGFHCHIVWHQSQGLMGAFISQPDAIRRIAIPPDNLALCNNGNPNIIDPGRRFRRSELRGAPHPRRAIRKVAATAAPAVLKRSFA